jgi:hypothetical protein
MRWLALTTCLASGLAGCVVADEPVPDACGASGMQDLVGKGKDVLAAMTFPQGTRVIEPGMAITEDYRTERLNIDLNEAGRIVRVWCG